MKYLKKYEELKLKYNKDDYVLIDVDKIFKETGNLRSELDQEPAKIINIEIDDLTSDVDLYTIYPFLVEFDNGNLLNVGYHEIIRKLTSNEI